MTLVIVVGLSAMGQGIVEAIQVAWVREVLRGGALALGLLGTAGAVGGLIGPLVVGWLGGVVQ